MHHGTDDLSHGTDDLSHGADDGHHGHHVVFAPVRLMPSTNMRECGPESVLAALKLSLADGTPLWTEASLRASGGGADHLPRAHEKGHRDERLAGWDGGEAVGRVHNSEARTIYDPPHQGAS